MFTYTHYENGKRITEVFSDQDSRIISNYISKCKPIYTKSGTSSNEHHHAYIDENQYKNLFEKNDDILRRAIFQATS